VKTSEVLDVTRVLEAAQGRTEMLINRLDSKLELILSGLALIMDELHLDAVEIDGKGSSTVQKIVSEVPSFSMAQDEPLEMMCAGVQYGAIAACGAVHLEKKANKLSNTGAGNLKKMSTMLGDLGAELLRDTATTQETFDSGPRENAAIMCENTDAGNLETMSTNLALNGTSLLVNAVASSPNGSQHFKNAAVPEDAGKGHCENTAITFETIAEDAGTLEIRATTLEGTVASKADADGPSKGTEHAVERSLTPRLRSFYKECAAQKMTPEFFQTFSGGQIRVMARELGWPTFDG